MRTGLDHKYIPQFGYLDKTRAVVWLTQTNILERVQQISTTSPQFSLML